MHLHVTVKFALLKIHEHHHKEDNKLGERGDAHAEHVSCANTNKVPLARNLIWLPDLALKTLDLAANLTIIVCHKVYQQHASYFEV